jgi:transposase
VDNVSLTKAQWKKILEFLRTRKDIYIGEPKNCKRFICANIWMLRSGAQWRLLPKSYGDWNSVYKRYNRWSERGVFEAMFSYFSSDPDLETIMLDATIVRAHSSAGVKGGNKKRLP